MENADNVRARLPTLKQGNLLDPHQAEGFEGKEAKEQQESFQTSSSKKKNKANSPFYNVLSELMTENGGLSSVKTLNNGFREAYLIGLESSTARPLFKDFQCTERHFSIDKVYKVSENSQHGWAPIHYTEIHTSAKSGESIVVHVYLGRQAQYVYTQVKRKIGESSVDEKIQKEEEEIILTNLNASINELSFLLKETNQRYSKAKAGADKLEMELLQLSKDLGRENYFKNYVDLLRKFQTAVEHLSLYSEIEHPKLHYLSKQIDSLDGWSKKFEKINAPTVQHPASMGSKKEETPKPALLEEEQDEQDEQQDKKAFEEVYREASLRFDELNESIALDIEYSFDNIKTIRERQACCEEATVLFLALNELERSSRKAGQKESTKRFNNFIKHEERHRNSGLKLLEKEVSEGNVRAVSELFFMFGDKISDRFYLNFIETVVTKNVKNKENLIKISEFFNENSISYKRAVFGMSNSSIYPLSKEERVVLFNKPRSGELVWNVSLLFRVYCDENLEIFRMLLEHGANIHSWGINPKNDLGRVTILDDAPIFSVISAYSTKDYLKYLKLLVKFGANVNLKMHVQPSRDSNRSKLRLKSNKTLNSNRKKTKAMSVHGSIYLQPPLTYAANKMDWPYFNFILPYMPIGSIAYTFAVQSSDSELRVCEINALTANVVGVKFYSSREMVYQKVEEEGLESGPLMGHFFYPHPKPNNFQDLIIKYEMLELLYKALIDKLKEIDQRQLENNLEQLLLQGLQKHAAGVAVGVDMRCSAFHSILASHFLLLAYCSLSGTMKDKIKLLKKYQPKLYESFSGLYSKAEQLQQEWPMLIFDVYKDWEDALEKSHEAQASFSDESDNKSNRELPAVAMAAEKDVTQAGAALTPGFSSRVTPSLQALASSQPASNSITENTSSSSDASNFKKKSRRGARPKSKIHF